MKVKSSPSPTNESEATELKISVDSRNTRRQNPNGQEGWTRWSVHSGRVQRDDEFAAERRMVFDPNFLEHMARNTYVTQVDPASLFGQRKGEAKRKGPLCLHCMALSTYRRIQAEHWCSVLVGPVCRCPVPGLVHKECIFMAVQTVYNQINRGVRKVWN